jgi:ATP-dependent DNA ligase
VTRRKGEITARINERDCLPSAAEHPPAGAEWVHEIKHDGYRLMARRDPVASRFLDSLGHEWPLLLRCTALTCYT